MPKTMITRNASGPSVGLDFGFGTFSQKADVRIAQKLALAHYLHLYADALALNAEDPGYALPDNVGLWLIDGVKIHHNPDNLGILIVEEYFDNRVGYGASVELVIDGGDLIDSDAGKIGNVR